MFRSPPPYSLEFRRYMGEPVRAGCDLEDLSRDFEPVSAQPGARTDWPDSVIRTA